MKELHDNAIDYIRGAQTVTIENFTPEKTDVDQLQALGIAIINEKWQDFVFDYEALLPFSEQEPRLGDRIIWNEQEFMVAPLGQATTDRMNADELYKFVTSTRKRIRVHAKQIK